MKVFSPLPFNVKKVEEELGFFHELLRDNLELDEKKHILPFFNNHKNLATFIGFVDTNLALPDKYAFEFSIFEDFKADLAIGCTESRNYLFVEFEDAKQNSIFKKNGKKATLEWASRFEHGYSQVIDWFWKLHDLKQSDSFKAKFGQDLGTYNGLLVIGRDQFLDYQERQRLKWRKDFVKVNSKSVLCMTYDELYKTLKVKYEVFNLYAQIAFED